MENKIKCVRCDIEMQRMTKFKHRVIDGISVRNNSGIILSRSIRINGTEYFTVINTNKYFCPKCGVIEEFVAPEEISLIQDIERSKGAQ